MSTLPTSVSSVWSDQMTNQQELIEQAAAVRPEVMEKVAAILFVLEQHDSATAAEVADEIGKITTYTVEKLASVPGFSAGQRFGMGLGAAVIAGVAGTLSADLYDAAKRGLSKTRNFRAIMGANPEFKGLDRSRLQSTYNSIHRFAPEFTADPIMGGSLLKSVYDAGPGMDHVMVRELINNRKNLQDVKHTQFRMGPVPQLDLDRREDRQKEERENTFRTKMEDTKGSIRTRERMDDTAARTNERAEDLKSRRQELITKLRSDRAASKMQYGRQARVEGYKADLRYESSDEPNKKSPLPSLRVRPPR